MQETIDDILTEFACKGWQESVHKIEKTLEDKDKEIKILNNKLLRIRELIDRTPRQTSKEKAYIMLKSEIAEVIGDDKNANR